MPVDDKEIERIINNDREWRRHMLKSIEKLYENDKDLDIRVTRIETVQKFWNYGITLISSSAFGTLVFWVKTKIK